ncbi:alpha/beta hydrolase family protein [Frateuria sp. YIM B11624]|uniref:alpha/beta hydrolase family protein n=1 Tax=Frateuria sp. YIM B11624 TaxID=3143185 RepID=UPI003C716178
MQRWKRVARWIAGTALAACLGMPAPAALAAGAPSKQPTSGTLHGAPYRIDVPADWNGDLVMLMHGYEPQGAPRATPMEPKEPTQLFLGQGYAVAQSAYASQGWAVGDAIIDNERLRQLAVHHVGRPRHTYLVGFSLGGLEAAASLERYPHAYTGALILCGATVSTPELASHALLEPLVTFDALIPGVLPDLAAADAPEFVPPTVFATALKTHPAQAALLERRLQGTQTSLSLYYMVLRELEQRAGGMPVDNRTTVYRGFGDDAAFNRRVHRYAGPAEALAYADRNASLTGRIEVPLVMEWNVADMTIPSRLHGVYPEQVRAAGSGNLLTVLAPAGEGHCGFSDAQIGAAFGTLLQKTGAASR